jgi:hypothetical protein
MRLMIHNDTILALLCKCATNSILFFSIDSIQPTMASASELKVAAR